MLNFRRSLPAFKEKERLLPAIARNQVLIFTYVFQLYMLLASNASVVLVKTNIWLFKMMHRWLVRPPQSFCRK